MIATSIAAERRQTGMAALTDVDLVGRAREGDEQAIRAIVQRHNQRLFRSARAIVRNDAEAEDVVQATYVRAFTNLGAFRGEARLSTWLTRIALNEALGRMRRRRKTTGLEEIDMPVKGMTGRVVQFPTSPSPNDPEAELSRSQARRLLENAVDQLPVDFRAVFVLRDVEGMSTEETASFLDIRIETAKTRLHRARKLMRIAIERQFTGAFSDLFPFDGARCASMADRVVAALQAGNSADAS